MQTPAIQQHMMVAPDTFKAVLLQMKEGDSLQGGSAQLKALSPILLPELLAPALLLLWVEVSPVLIAQWEVHIGRDDLEPGVNTFPEKGGTQDRVMLAYLLPGLLKGREVQGTLKGQSQLHHVISLLGSVQALEQHALLQGGERIDRLDLPVVPQILVDLLLTQTRQREIRGGVFPDSLLLTMLQDH